MFDAVGGDARPTCVLLALSFTYLPLPENGHIGEGHCRFRPASDARSGRASRPFVLAASSVLALACLGSFFKRRKSLQKVYVAVQFPFIGVPLLLPPSTTKEYSP
ncbi:MAG: hypothetical protein J0I98_10465 [Mesorhizobium sp.]|nr:hypothetical protein [Mesorhizobium sp.]MBN9243206.1 hypothetical protein [Mesorhizobium sp.]